MLLLISLSLSLSFCAHSHVTMSVCKLLSRILAPKLDSAAKSVASYDEPSDRSIGASDDLDEDSDNSGDDGSQGSDFSSINMELKQRIQ